MKRKITKSRKRNPENKIENLRSLIRTIKLDLDYINFDLDSSSEEELEYMERKLKVIKDISHKLMD